MNDDKILLDAAYIKLRNDEPMSLIDLQRIWQLIERASFNVNRFDEAEQAGVQSAGIMMMQTKFMKGQTIQ
jgi:hypothetical protein